MITTVIFGGRDLQFLDHTLQEFLSEPRWATEELIPIDSWDRVFSDWREVTVQLFEAVLSEGEEPLARQGQGSQVAQQRSYLWIATFKITVNQREHHFKQYLAVVIHEALTLG